MSRLRFLFKFAWRNLGRHPFRTLIMSLGLGFGTGYIIFALNFSKSGSKEIIDDFLAQFTGDHQLVAPDFYPDLDKKKFDPQGVLREPQVHGIDRSRYVERISLPVFLSGPKKTQGTILTGLDADREHKLSKVRKALAQGSFLPGGAPNELVLGERLARRLGVGLGDDVVVMGQGLDGSSAVDLFRVVGLMNFGGGDMEDAVAFTSLGSARSFGVLPADGFHQLIRFAGQAQAPPAPPAGVVMVPWEEILPEVNGSIKFIDIFTWIVAVILVIVISLGMGNTLMITFLEREKEFYSLNVIGVRSSWIAWALAIEVFFLALIGIGAGVLLGNLVTAYFYHNPISLLLFTGGKPIMMGGMAIIPKVRLYAHHHYSWQAPLLVAGFLALSLVLPIYRVIQRSKRVN